MSLSRITSLCLKSSVLRDTSRQSCLAVSRRFAGHSHWQNTRHIKAATDAHKSKTRSRFVRLIAAAVAAGGGPDPRFNNLLSQTIEQAKKTQVVTNAVIEAAIKRAAETPSQKSTVSKVYELFGEKGVLAVARVETSNVATFQHDLKIVCRRHTWGIAKGGVKERFEEKNYVLVSGKEGGTITSSDEVLAMALEGGAEDMNEIEEEGVKMYEFTCAPGTQFVFAKVLREASYLISDTGTKWLPMVTVELDDAQTEKVQNFCSALEELPDVIEVFTNLA